MTEVPNTKMSEMPLEEHFAQVKAAAERVKGKAHLTPIFTSEGLDAIVGGSCFFKGEHLQKIGAFKFRGAVNAISLLSPEEKARGVITHSSGNHAQAVALAAKYAGIKATIVMPQNAPPVKVAATKGYGAEIVVSGNKPHDRDTVTAKLVAERHLSFIHPSNDINVIYGQGTAALEMMHQCDNLDYLFCPVGGGGLLSGTAIATKGSSRKCKVIAVEPALADDAFRSLRDGKIYPSVSANTIADGLRTSLGSNTYPIIKKWVDEVMLVDELEIVDAMQLIMERLKLVIEPSGAVAFAGVLKKSADGSLKGKRIGVVVCGGNIDMSAYFDSLRKSVQPKPKL